MDGRLSLSFRVDGGILVWEPSGKPEMQVHTLPSIWLVIERGVVMNRRGPVFVLVALVGLTLGWAASLAAQSAEQVPGETPQASEGFKLARVWTSYAISQRGRSDLVSHGSVIRTIRPGKGGIFVLVDFELVAETATITPVLLDSAGTRYTPPRIAPFSTDLFVDLSNATEVQSRSPTGHRVDVRDISRQVAISASKPGARFAVAWEVPEATALRPSEFRLYIDDGKPILIDTVASARMAPLQEAARVGNAKLIAQALTEGADVNATDDQGWTLLHTVARHDSKNVAELLMAKGAEPNSKDRQGRTPLHLAAGATLRKGVAELLLANGAEFDVKDNDGQTPLHLAAMIGNKAVAELLLAKGAEVNAKDRQGWTPLHLAALNGEKAVVELLLVKGAEVNARSEDGKTPLDVATAEAMKVLLRKYGAK